MNGTIDFRCQTHFKIIVANEISKAYNIINIAFFFCFLFKGTTIFYVMNKRLSILL